MTLKVSEVLVVFCIVASFKLSSFSVTAADYTKCEGSLFNPFCKDDTKRIAFTKATYGRASTDLCPYPGKNKKLSSNTECGTADNALKIIQDTCNGRATCKFNVTNQFFGSDPCPGFFKYLDAAFRCVKALN